MVWVWASGMENQSKTKSCSEKIVTVCLFFFFFKQHKYNLRGFVVYFGKKNGKYEVMLKAGVKHYL